MDQTKSVKLTLDIFGVSVEASFIRNENVYRALIPTTTALRCYQAVIKRLAENNLPEDTAITVDVSNNLYKTYKMRLARFYNDDNDNSRHVFVITIEVYYNNHGNIEVSHNMFDWLQAQKMDTKRAKKAFGHK